jgi:hypothetical protein
MMSPAAVCVRWVVRPQVMVTVRAGGGGRLVAATNGYG